MRLRVFWVFTGPTDQRDACPTCGQMAVHCPGHMGHIILPMPVYNPVLFNTLVKVIMYFRVHLTLIRVVMLLVILHKIPNLWRIRVYDMYMCTAVKKYGRYFTWMSHVKTFHTFVQQYWRSVMISLLHENIKESYQVR